MSAINYNYTYRVEAPTNPSVKMENRMFNSSIIDSLEDNNVTNISLNAEKSTG